MLFPELSLALALEAGTYLLNAYGSHVVRYQAFLLYFPREVGR